MRLEVSEKYGSTDSLVGSVLPNDSVTRQQYSNIIPKSSYNEDFCPFFLVYFTPMHGESVSPQRPHGLIQADFNKDEDPLQYVDGDVDTSEDNVVHAKIIIIQPKNEFRLSLTSSFALK